MKTIIIGDVHGCYREMMEILSKIGPTNSDQVYFTGDLINKGPDSKKVIEEVMQNGYRSILGNHEWSYLKIFFTQTHKTSLPTLQAKKYPVLNELLYNLSDEENQWLSNLPFYWNTEDFLLVHGGVFPDRPLFYHKPVELLNLRTIDNQPWHDYYRGDKLIVYGHWARQGLKLKKNSIGLDSGCVYGQSLSALVLPERKIVQVNSQTSAL